MKEDVPTYILTALLGPNMGTEHALQDVDIWVSSPIREVFMAHRAVDIETSISISEMDIYREAVGERNRRVALLGRISSLLVLSETVRAVFAGKYPSENEADMIRSWLEDV